jgi:dTDP-4-dehydrorhamnose 3,5-epimerase-like enzyme
MNNPSYQTGKLRMPAATLYTVRDVRLLELPRFSRADGEIVVAQAAQVPFAITRMFTLTAPIGSVRGEHAHRRCTQFMLCVHGAVEVVCDDGRDRKAFVLDRNDLAVCVPPTIWNEVIFREDRSVVIVLCDRPFEEFDYLREYPEFLSFRKSGQA